uniref:Uncharacterized protein n=1 Tax=Romanomermis culicivorax TaxID=13658 RepID=A0A915KAQ4_ROMCU
MSSERRNSALIEDLEKEILMTPVADRKQMKKMLDTLVDETVHETIEEEKARPHHGNPAVIGLAAFAITATLFQFHNFGWVSKNPVMCLGVVLGGIIQLFAGLLEFANGNNFGMAVFSGYGSFWISLIAIMVLNDYTRYTIFKIVAAVFLLINSMAAFYLLACILLESAYKRPVLPVGLPVHKYIAKIRGIDDSKV